ncbi:ABC-2 type transporter [Colletotrichum higginsianum IMI 349063]|uniref:ABC-2 type transporter n=3 Tax=Colletotrichum higginsianum TaxID=80884 RepID=A0A1B7YT29_COLHI|nr:ABC-2 type transporter [Colletotrichum higginsianum IMI 349063]OBR15190.1 ABC-2 type transporter [Colletotrichum higginsianum IMI 349063]TID03850.1 Brefeldin A resistance protein [Colletotrichum higginsianum]
MAEGTRPESDGRWGENAAGDISVNAALEEFHDLEKELSTIQHRHSAAYHQKTKQTQGDGHGDGHGDAGGESDSTIAPSLSGENSFDLPDFLRRGIMDMRTPSGGPTKRLGVSFKNLTVKGVESSTKQVVTFPRDLVNTFGPDLYHFIAGIFPKLRLRKEPTVDLVRNMTGTVRHGEIMLVLGRPGSGCSTFLKAIANHREEYAQVDGEVYYGVIPAEDQLQRFRGEVVYCEEDDRHFPSLTVWQTLWFALKTKTRKREQWTIPPILDSLLQMFGIEHTKNTLVGDEHTRGVSGGERKRVSLAETLATRASVVCWDNSTRGLDASTALSFAKSLRVYTDVSGRTTLVTLYQAGESIYELMDKVLVIDDGRMLFQGPAGEAKKYFEDLGYLCPPRQTTADFLTSIADKNARHFQPGREETAPKTPEELERAFRESEHYRRVAEDVEDYERGSRSANNDKHRMFEATVKDSKSKTVIGDSVYTVSFAKQVAACTKRQAWLLWGDRSSFYTKLVIIVANSLIVSSLFYGAGQGTSSAFARGGIVFFSIAFIGWLQFAELLPAIAGRTTIERQRVFAFYRPSAVVIARVLLDFPLILVMTVLFCVPVYFLAQFDVDAAKFWIYTLIVYTVTFCLTTMYRMFASLSSTVDDAVRFVGVVLNIMFILTGYVIPKPALLNDSIWFGWIYFINPVAYGFEALQTNEFFGRQMQCSESQLVPRGPGSDPNYQGCSLPGSTLGSTTVSGPDYLEASFQYSRANLWRNFGIIIAFTVFYLGVTVLAVETVKFKGTGAQSLIFAKGRAAKADEEQREKDGARAAEEAFEPIGDGQSVFTFKDINYTVPYGDGERRLLDGVCGFAKPGKMIALMGSSGAGKTTLLNTIAQRQKVGVVSGEMLVNGAALGPEFQRGTGFCEQRDIHEGTATIREALEFSALLRQERAVPRADKIAYVDRIVHLLELGDLQHAIISSLTVEQRKRVTIGVELAAKPSLLLFLDEPTSGLDSQSAFSIVRFLRKLCDAGQAIICTIHQPSSDLIEQFDMILALNRGGRTFYFGPVGPNGSVVVDYFARRGFPCPPSRNVAEFILETASTPSVRDGERVDWNDEWRRSDEHGAIVAEIDRITAERRPPAATDAAQTEFAASTAYQCLMLTKRMFVQHWREPQYLYSRVFVHTIMGIFNGFTFWMLGNDIASMQNRMFSAIILIFFIPPTVVNSVVLKFFQNRELWEDRELPSRTYGWVAFCTANVVCEIPMAVVSATIYWLLWYFPVGYPATASVSGYTYLMVLVWSFFQSSWGQWISAFGPSYSTISNILPFFFVMVAIFNGILVPYDSMPVFWSQWMYFINPTTWFARGVLSAVLPPAAVQCAAAEFARFDPPPGSTCGQYAGRFVDEVAATGYLEDPNATSNCGYCPYNDGGEYMRTLNVYATDKWPSFGILVAFAIANWALVYFFIYTVRIRGWTFGISSVRKQGARVLGRFRGQGKQAESEDV